MKKFNKNIVVFVLCMVFVIIGLFSTSVLRPIAGSFFRLIKGQNTFEEAKTTITDTANEAIIYHNQMVDLNSLKENILGTRIIKKGESFIVKNDEGYLGYSSKVVVDNNTVNTITSKIKELEVVAEENNAQFLYCCAPTKEYYYKFPSNTVSENKKNKEKLLNCFTENNIPYIDFMHSFKNNDIDGEDLFFRTDHHWRVYPGFIAAKAICEELNSKYGFSYDKKIVNIENYNVKKYYNYFLGSIGKKVGTYFTWQGADDFELITPKFKTNMTEEQPYKNSTRTGSFEESVLFMDNMEKDYYNKSPYATYSGGDFHLQIMRNNLNPEGKKILLIRDSFACVVAPFLALHTSELHICDMRNLDGMVGDAVNVKDYIQKEKPDYVIVLYNGVGSKDDIIYDFFQ